ncbi:MAG: hypothetical protein PHQ89_02335 [Bacilli bacterium]|nr:hypothetical protein [Bacilli bacterium]
MKKYNEEEIMNYMNKIDYGWIGNNSNENNLVDKSFSDNYFLQSPKQVLKSKVGICWDQVELERFYFKNYNNVKTYFICHYDGDKCPTHTFLTYEKGNKYYWFEHSFPKYRGVHEFNNIKDLLKTVKQNFIETDLNNKYEERNLLIREYTKPKYGLNVQEFYKHCEKNMPIDINSL